jgi:hypothetical protein
MLDRLRAAHDSQQHVEVANSSVLRDLFVSVFLSEVFPSAFRFESGEALDTQGRQSGSLDIVIESPFVPCVPGVQGTESRWYLAEGVAAAIQVHANLMTDWDAVLAGARRLAILHRNFASFSTNGPAPMRRIPLFVAGYAGWTTPEAVKQRLSDGELDGILVIEPAIFVGGPAFAGVVARGPWALWTFIASLHQAISGLATATSELWHYAMERSPVVIHPSTESPAESHRPGKEAKHGSGIPGRRALRQPG